MPAKEMEPSLSSSGMGGKETSGSARPPLRAPRPPRAPIPHSPAHSRLIESGRLARLEQWASGSPVVDALYLAGVWSVLMIAGYILAFG
jgi:hypothetical protein